MQWLNKKNCGDLPWNTIKEDIGGYPDLLTGRKWPTVWPLFNDFTQPSYSPQFQSRGHCKSSKTLSTLQDVGLLLLVAKGPKIQGTKNVSSTNILFLTVQSPDRCQKLFFYIKKKLQNVYTGYLKAKYKHFII